MKPKNNDRLNNPLPMAGGRNLPVQLVKLFQAHIPEIPVNQPKLMLECMKILEDPAFSSAILNKWLKSVRRKFYFDYDLFFDLLHGFQLLFSTKKLSTLNEVDQEIDASKTELLEWFSGEEVEKPKNSLKNKGKSKFS